MDRAPPGALAGLAVHQVESSLASLAASGALIELPVGPRRTIRVLAELAAELEERVLRALGRLHAAHPRQSAIPRAQLAAAFPDLANEALVASLIDRLKARGKVVADRRTVALPGFEPKLSQADRKLKNELAESIRAGGLSPPDAAELAAAFAAPRARSSPSCSPCSATKGKWSRSRPNLFLDSGVERELRRRVAERLAGGSAITMSELRDLLGTSRKFAVPIGEYLDRIGLTRREGDVRRLGLASDRVSASPTESVDSI